MSRIKIKNFGPVKEGFIENDGWMEIKKVTAFIGNNGSGKSTVAKLVSIFSWIEKDLFRSDGSTLRFRKQERIFKKYLEYHRIDSYLKTETEIEYEGEAYGITYKNGHNLEISPKKNSSYILPKITYYPAERNFVSSVKKSKGNLNLKLWSQSLQEFKETFQEAKENFKEKETLPLPIGDVAIEYNKLNDILYVKGTDYKIQLSDSASGYQSFIPLFVVTHYITTLLKEDQEMDEQQRETFKRESAQILKDKTYTEEQKRILLSNLAAQFNIKRILNIVEEPEQNLFPTSQQNVLNSLLECNNAIAENQLVISTHSPYILSALNNAIMAADVFEQTGKEIDSYKMERRVPFENISAYKYENGHIFSIKDEETRLISADAIDSCSTIINSDFDELLDLLPENDN